MTSSNGAWERFALIVLAIIGIGLISVSSEDKKGDKGNNAVPSQTSSTATQTDLNTIAANQTQ